MIKIVKSRRALRALDVVVILATIGAASFGVMRLLANDDKDICKAVGIQHELQLKDGTFTTQKLAAQRCDTITVVNLDTQKYSLSFGTHEAHVDYPGFEPQLLAANESINIDMIVAGKYHLHDHLRNAATVEINVAPLGR